MTESAAANRSREDRSREERVQALYWHSDRGVNSIADELGLSKSRLYELIRPLAADVPCPECGSTLAYDNRTARDRGEAACPNGCGEPAEPLDLPPAGAGDTRRLLGGLALGVAACLLIIRLIRR
jgi:predicted RNA-binding Zn-ribbon protein involved in translation (DUF1610 family)